MSTHPTFVELNDPDPAVRAIARRVQQYLGNNQLDAEERIRLVRRAQRELREHQTRAARAEAIRDQLAEVRVPAGFRPRQVQVKGQAVSVGLRGRNAFAWLDAGQLKDAGPATNAQRFDWNAVVKRTAHRADAKRSGIEERRRAAEAGRR